jgi:hypothetical protein
VSYVINALEVLDVVFQLVLIFFLLRGPYRRYVTLFTYSIAFLAVTTFEAIFTHLPNYDKALYRRIYWSDEVATDLLFFLVVISLTNLALEGSPQRPRMSRILLGIVLVVLILPFLILHPAFFTSGLHWSTEWGHWFNSTSQMLNFGAAIMNLALWSALLTSRKRDPQLVKVSIGVGVAVAGQAIGFGIRRFLPTTPGSRDVPDIFMAMTHLLGVLLWCSAFRPKPKPSPAAQSVTLTQPQ